MTNRCPSPPCITTYAEWLSPLAPISGILALAVGMGGFLVFVAIHQWWIR